MVISKKGSNSYFRATGREACLFFETQFPYCRTKHGLKIYGYGSNGQSGALIYPSDTPEGNREYAVALVDNFKNSSTILRHGERFIQDHADRHAFVRLNYLKILLKTD